jgi:hypothetical protein
MDGRIILEDNESKATEVEVLKHEGEVAADYVPEGYESQEEFLADMRKEYELDLEADRENREQALDDKKFAAGEQWDPIVLEQRKGLPCLVINSVPQFTAQLVGDWRESRKAVKVVPSEDGDTEIASIRGDLIRSIEMQSRASRVYDTAFESLIQCGDGAFRVAVEYARDDVFDQEIRIKPVDDILSTVWDRMSLDPTGRDARHVFVDDIIPEKEFKRRWKDADQSELSTSFQNQLRVTGWVNDSGVRVTEYWRMIERKRLLGLFEDGSVRVLDGDKYDELVESHGLPVRTRLAPCLYAQMHLVTGFKILAGPFEYKLNRVPIVRMTGRIVNVAGRRIRYGLVRFMKDPVRLKNFWRSVAAEQLGYAPKAQWIATETAVEGREDDIRKAHLTRDPLLVVNDEAVIGQNIQRLDPPVPQAALLNEAQVNAQDMKDVTGIHDASLGIKSNETSGRAINARQREGDIASLTYYDNGNAAVLEAGDVINQLISQVYDSTRIIRIIGEDQEMKFMAINDPANDESPDLSVGNYDVALSTGSSYTTRRVEAAQSMMEAIQVWPQLIQVAGDIVAKAQDWPGADKLAERLKKTIPANFLDDDDPDKQAAGQPTPEQIQQGMMELQATKQELEALKADKSIEREKLEIEAYNAYTLRIRALSDNEVDGNELQLKAIDNILKQSLAVEQHQEPANEED